jgi:hypothetical protein
MQFCFLYSNFAFLEIPSFLHFAGIEKFINCMPNTMNTIKPISHGTFFLATCNIILLLRDVNLPNTMRPRYILLFTLQSNSLHYTLPLLKLKIRIAFQVARKVATCYGAFDVIVAIPINQWACMQWFCQTYNEALCIIYCIRRIRKMLNFSRKSELLTNTVLFSTKMPSKGSFHSVGWPTEFPFRAHTLTQTGRCSSCFWKCIKLCKKKKYCIGSNYVPV